jgi:hypothetical protein
MEEWKNEPGICSEIRLQQACPQRSARYGSSRCVAMIARRFEIFFSSNFCMIASRFAAKQSISRAM